MCFIFQVNPPIKVLRHLLHLVVQIQPSVSFKYFSGKCPLNAQIKLPITSDIMPLAALWFVEVSFFIFTFLVY